jgi:hypothetical protein
MAANLSSAGQQCGDQLGQDGPVARAPGSYSVIPNPASGYRSISARTALTNCAGVTPYGSGAPTDANVSGIEYAESITAAVTVPSSAR